MKRLLLVLCATLVLPFVLVGQDASLALDTSATLSQLQVQDFTIFEKATPSFTLPLGKAAEFAGSGYVQGAYSSAKTTDAFTYSLQQFDLKLTLQNPQEGVDTFFMDVGRFLMSDPSGNVLSSPADGVAFTFNYPGFNVALRSAYTGLLFLKDSSSSRISMSLADQARISAGTDLTGSRRFLIQADLELPDLAGQSFVLSVLSQNDLNPSNMMVEEGSTKYEPGEGGRLNTQYIELNAKGTVSSVSYNAFFVYGMGSTLSWMSDSSSKSGYSYSYQPISSFLVGLRAAMPLAIALPESSVALQLIFASGEKDATSATEGNTASVYKQFTPINSPTLGAAFSPSLGNLVVGQASFSAIPKIGPLSIAGTGKILSFFRPTSGPISAPGIAADSTSAYLGSEADIVLFSGILSDLGVSCTLGAFIPGDAFSSDARKVQYYCNLTATVKL